MRNILVDAGPLIALFRANDTHHRQAVQWAMRTKARLITTWPVVGEVCFFLGPAGKQSLFAFIQRGAVEIADLVVTDLTRLSELAAKYPRMDFADGTLVLLAERMRVTDIATIDERDFGIYRTKGGQVFRNLFG